jgi:hypothetical protein
LYPERISHDAAAGDDHVTGTVVPLARETGPDDPFTVKETASGTSVTLTESEFEIGRASCRERVS